MTKPDATPTGPHGPDSKPHTGPSEVCSYCGHTADTSQSHVDAHNAESARRWTAALTDLRADSVRRAARMEATDAMRAGPSDVAPGAHSKVRAILDADTDLLPTVPAFAWPGGYPLYYIRREVYGSDGYEYSQTVDHVCSECATRVIRESGPEQTDAGDTFDPSPSGVWIVDYDTHDEGAPIMCDECGREIESAYGDPDADLDGPDDTDPDPDLYGRDAPAYTDGNGYLLCAQHARDTYGDTVIDSVNAGASLLGYGEHGYIAPVFDEDLTVSDTCDRPHGYARRVDGTSYRTFLPLGTRPDPDADLDA